MKALIIRYKIHVIFGAVGGGVGFLYWKLVGCASGSCPITSVWYTSTAYGAVLGLLAGSAFFDSLTKNKKDEQIQ